jgi:hypothetical protein
VVVQSDTAAVSDVKSNEPSIDKKRATKEIQCVFVGIKS